MVDNNNNIQSIDDILQVLNKVVTALHLTEVLHYPAEDGIASFILILEDREGNKFGTTLVCKEAYEDYNTKAFQSLQGFPLHPEPNKDGANTEG